MKETSLCYLERDGEYLMLHRIKKKNDDNSGKWIGIGGKLEPGESPEECAEREVFEETGLKAELVYRGIVDFINTVYESERMHLFTSEEFSGQMHECDEGVLAFVKKDQVCNLPLWEGDHVFLDLLARDVPFFKLVLNYEGEKLISSHVVYLE